MSYSGSRLNVLRQAQEIIKCRQTIQARLVFGIAVSYSFVHEKFPVEAVVTERLIIIVMEL